MTTNEVQDVRIDTLETRIDRHEMLLEKLTDNQLELSTRLTELATPIDWRRLRFNEEGNTWIIELFNSSYGRNTGDVIWLRICHLMIG